MESKLKEQFGKPVVVGIVSAIGAKALGLTYTMELPLIKMDVSGPVFYALLGMGSSLLSETLHQWVLPLIPQSGDWVKAENALISPVLHAATNVVALKLLYPPLLERFGYRDPMMLGFGAELAGTYAWDNVVKGLIL